MAEYIVKRVVVAFLTILLIMTITFLLMNAVPGSPFMTEKSTPEMIARANAKYGLDKPLIVQLWNYIKNYLQGDLGTSLKMQEGTSVRKIIFEEGKFALSFKLGVWAVVVAVIIGVPLGCLAAYNRGRALDSFLRVVTTLGVAVPSFVLCSILLIYLSVKLQWLPVISGSLDSWKSYIAPVIGLSFYPMCYVAKLTRTSMLDAINQDYIRTARAKGLGERTVIWKHVFKNALIPILTMVGSSLGNCLAGSVLVEMIFNIPGMGMLMNSSIMSKDFITVQSCILICAFVVAIANLLTDLAYAFVDPRIRAQYSSQSSRKKKLPATAVPKEA